MKRNFDEIVASSLKGEFNSVICPDPREELNVIKMKLKKRVRIMRMKTYASICAIFLIIPFIFLTYANRYDVKKIYSTGANVTAPYNLDELVNDSALVVNGEVNKVFVEKKNKYAEVTIKEVLKGIPYNEKRILVKVVNIDFELEEEVLLFLSDIEFNKSDTDKKYYILENVQGKYVMEKDSESTFVNNEFPESKIKISLLRNEVKKN
jgi:hypothetical protein